MYDDEEISVVGIMSEKEHLTDSTSKNELKKIFYDALSIGPMF